MRRWRLRRFGASRCFRRYQVHPIQVRASKRQTIEDLAEVFSKGAERRTRDHESEVRDLHAKIGELVVERDFLSRESCR